MNRATLQPWHRLRAASLLVLLLFSVVGAPAALALPEQERCAMHCAESEEGVCCCILDQRERLAERSHDSAPVLTQFQQRCASTCAATPSGGNHVYAHKDLLTAVCAASRARSQQPSHQAVNPRPSLLCRQSTPRAPPLRA